MKCEEVDRVLDIITCHHDDKTGVKLLVKVDRVLDIITYHHDDKTGVKLLVKKPDNRYYRITVSEIDLSKVSLTIAQDSYAISDEPQNKVFKNMQGKKEYTITIPIKEDYNTHELFTVEGWDK